ncbi:hypothetical protein K2P97_06940 [bacterium]|nr:hypothetical protein [bacterium]
MRQEVEYFKNELTECVNIDMMKSLALTKFSAAFFGLISIGFLFSCSQQQGKSLLSAQTTSQDAVAAILDKVPFAYDVAIDTISYNSCVGIGLNSEEKIHGIKIGANEGFVDGNGTGAVKGGIKLKSDFIQYLSKNVPPNFPNTSVSAGQIQHILQNSKNKDLQIQYAVRTAADLKIVPDVADVNNAQSQQIQMGRDGIYIGGSLANDPTLTAITKDVKFGANGSVLSEGPRVYNLGSKSSPLPLQGSLGFSVASDETFPVVANVDDGVGAGEQPSDVVRSKFNSFAYVLAVTFGNQLFTSSSDTTPSLGFNSLKRPDEKDLRKAFGRSYELSFITKNASIPSWRKNILNRVTEKNLEDGRVVSGVTWTCENYVIVKSNQLNNRKSNEPSCTELIGSDLNIPSIAAKVKMLRRHYAEDKWAIGFFYNAGEIYVPASRPFTNHPTNTIERQLCLVSKAADCYLPTVGIIPSALNEDVGVQYNPNQECYLSRAIQMGVTYTPSKTGDVARRLGRCAQFASICSRTSTSF